jgi:hypothetical protein
MLVGMSLGYTVEMAACRGGWRAVPPALLCTAVRAAYWLGFNECVELCAAVRVACRIEYCHEIFIENVFRRVGCLKVIKT